MPGWQAFDEEVADKGATVVTVALDLDREQALPWIEAATPTHPSLIDSAHLTDELFGFNNVPMAVWIDENGMIVRPAESASIEVSELKSMKIADEWPEPLKQQLRAAQAIPDNAVAYRAAALDWIEHGADSAYAMTPAEVITASQPRDADKAAAAAHFEMGQHLFSTSGKDAAIPYWRRAHELDPGNWTYKRQAWTLETTPQGQPSDLMQPPTDVYEGSWLADVEAAGGGENYVTVPGFV